MRAMFPGTISTIEALDVGSIFSYWADDEHYYLLKAVINESNVQADVCVALGGDGGAEQYPFVFDEIPRHREVIDRTNSLLFVPAERPIAHATLISGKGRRRGTVSLAQDGGVHVFTTNGASLWVLDISQGVLKLGIDSRSDLWMDGYRLVRSIPEEKFETVFDRNA